MYSRLDGRVYVWSEKDERDFSYGRIHLPYRFTRDGLQDETPSFDASQIDVNLESSNSFRAVPQSKFKDIDTMTQANTFENYIESLHDSERDMLRNVEMIV